MQAHLTDRQLADAGVGVTHHFGGGVYIKETIIPAGAALAQHAHEHDHLSYLVHGAVTVRADGVGCYYDTPGAIVIKAGQMHEVRAYVDSTWLCIWATDRTDPETIDAALSP